MSIPLSRLTPEDQVLHPRSTRGFGNALHSFHLRPPEDFGTDDLAMNALGQMLNLELADKLKICIRDAEDMISRSVEDTYYPYA